MKKTILALSAIAVALVMTACSHEEDDIFDQSAAERLNAISAIYTQRLVDSRGGWVMEYYPYSDNEDLITGLGYLIMNRFHDNGSVYTLMKNTASHNSVWADSTAWEIITDMGPVLTFNTYNKCYGRFSDPDDIDLTPGTYDDESGKGFQGDYEFVMVDVPENGDHVMLKGKKRGVYQRLSRLPEGTDFESYLDDIATFNANHFVKNAPWELTMVEGGKKYRMNWMFRGYASVYPEGSDSTTYGWHEPFLVTKYNDEYHLRFKDTLMVEGHQMEQEFAYSAADDKFYGVIDKSNTIEGYPPYAFFTETVSDMHVWNLSKSGEMSEKLKTLIDAIDNDFSSLKDNKNRSYAFIGINFGRNVQTTDGVRDTVDCWSVVYRSPGSSRNTSANFIFNASFSGDDSMSLQYKEPINVASQNVANKFNNIYDLWSLLSRKFVISAAETRFNLTHIKLVASDDPDLWMILNY